MNPSIDPWFWAMSDSRNYITPEDIESALRAGASNLELYEIVLLAIANKSCEDISGCAFMALSLKE